jgi:hypothetical protein
VLLAASTVALASAVATGVDVSTDAWAPPDVSAVVLVLVPAVATGASTVVVVVVLKAAVVLTLAVLVLVLAVVAEEVVSTETCGEGSDGGVAERAAAVPVYASAANPASSAATATRRALREILTASCNLDPLEICRRFFPESARSISPERVIRIPALAKAERREPRAVSRGFGSPAARRQPPAAPTDVSRRSRPRLPSAPLPR